MSTQAKSRPTKFTIRRSTGERVFEAFNITILISLGFVCLFPFINSFANAFSSDAAIAAGRVTLIPVDVQTEAMTSVLMNTAVLRSLMVTIFITVVGTSINLFLTVITAYPLARRDLKGRKIIIQLIVFTMLFKGGMIPLYLVVRSLGLLNSTWSVILPTAIITFNLLVMKTFFQNVPWELREAAMIEGAGNTRILFSIIVPLSVPAIVTIMLFYMVNHWNSFFSAMLYIDDPSIYPLQIKLRELLLLGTYEELLEGRDAGVARVNEESLKAATVVFATIPILVVYPWLQKYFVKGAMIGAVKG